MPGLCPVCGNLSCAHNRQQREQTLREYYEDIFRELTLEEREALKSGDSKKKLVVAQEIARRRKLGIFPLILSKVTQTNIEICIEAYHQTHNSEGKRGVSKD